MTIECKNLHSTYIPSLARPILKGINCQIKNGEFVALLGLNGAGKSSLLRSIVGLMPLTQGEIRINDLLLTTNTVSKIRRDVAMLFQGGGLVRQLSALDNVLCGKLGTLSTWQTLWGFRKSDRERARELLIELGLKNQIEQKTAKLSGGQQQKVAIARALMQSPQILLADEPIAGLDVMAASQVMDILARLNQEKGITIIAILHDLEIARIYADRAIVLNEGSIVYEGNCNNLQAQFSKI